MKHPSLPSRTINDTLVVFLSMVFRGWFLEPIGTILSVPTTSLVQIAPESDQDTRGLVIMQTGLRENE